jgi:hypothetical protein
MKDEISDFSLPPSSLSFLAPINIVTKFKIQSQNVKSQHSMRAELAQFPRVARLQRFPFLGRELVLADGSLEIGGGLFQDSPVHLEIEKKPIEMVTAHGASGAISNFKF